MNRCRHYAFLACAVGLLAAGCATSRQETPPAITPPKTWPRVTLEQDVSTLDETVRRIGREIGGGLVMMNGVGHRQTPPIAVKRARYPKFAASLAGYTGCTCARTPWFFFLYSGEYEVYASLLETSLKGKLHPSYRDVTLKLLSGDRTPLYNVLILLGQGNGLTIIADNLVADSLCGEVGLDTTPLDAALEALLMSARVAPDAWLVDSTEEYIFIHGAGNVHPPSLLLNEASLGSEQRALLEKRVSVELPTPADSERQVYYATAVPLSQVLDTLSDQLGIRVTADERLLDFPINPCAMNNVRLCTAMDLLIRQWPVAEFGYELRQEDILIRPR